MSIRVGDTVPSIKVQALMANGKFETVDLASYRGKWFVLFFYPLDFTAVCPTEIRGFNAGLEEFKKANSVVLGMSVDSVHSHKAWFQRDLPEVKFPIIGDTTHRLTRDFGILKEDQGIAYRGTFIIDPEGIIRYQVVSDLSIGRNVDETLRVLQALQTGELCPIDWKPGMKTLGKA